MAWQPLVDGDDGAIRRAIAELVAEIDRRPATTVDEHVDRAILHAYLAEVELADDDPSGIERAAQLVAEHGTTELYGGAARVGWALAHLAGGEDIEAACRAIDARVLEAVPRHGAPLVFGVSGFAVYAVERGEAGRALAERVVAWLGETMKPGPVGAAWFTSAEQLAPSQREHTPDGQWNLGVAHGLAGTIGALARLAMVGDARALLEPAVACLLAVPAGSPDNHFPLWVDGPPAYPLGWCYGDLGTAHVLVGAGLHTGVARWRDEGLALARACAARVPEVRDATFCHGAAGIAHLFHRMAVATGDRVLADAARAWIDRTLAMRDAWLTDTSTILAGAPGIALVLAAAITELEPLWDRLLLADLPM